MSDRLLHRRLLLGLGLGIGLGAAATTLAVYLLRNRFKLSSDISHLAAKIECLQKEVDELRTSVLPPPGEDAPDTLQLSRPDSFFSLPGSSEDDDDEFLDTLDLHQELGAESITSDDFLSADEDSPDAAQVLQSVDHLLEGSKNDEAYRLLKGIENSQTSNPSFLWRMAKATYLKSQAIEDQEQKKTLVYASEKMASTALRLKPDDSNVQKWCAITLGSVGDFESIQVKIQNGYKFKEHIERAINLNPSDPASHYLLGRWCYGVYMLSWVERRVAATLFATPPSATVDEALEHFLQAEKLKPGMWKENLLYISKCYIEKSDYSEAVRWLDRAKSAPKLSHDDRIAEQEVDTLLQKYNYYRS